MKLKLTLAMLAFSATAAQADSITAIAAVDERFSTLVAAVTAAGLAETLAGPGPFTVFAPVNDAFAALPAGTVETLLKPENKGQLTDILMYHVDDRNLPAAAIPAGSNYFKPMLTSQRLCITAGADGVTIADGTGEMANGDHRRYQGRQWRDPCDRQSAAAGQAPCLPLIWRPRTKAPTRDVIWWAPLCSRFRGRPAFRSRPPPSAP